MTTFEIVKKVVKLKKKNPELPIKAIVYEEAYDVEIGEINGVTIDEYINCNRTGKICFRSDDDIFEALENYYTREEFDALRKCGNATRSNGFSTRELTGILYKERRAIKCKIQKDKRSF